MSDPITTLGLFNAIATAGRTIFDLAQGASNSDAKRRLMEIYDTLMGLKRQAAELEDENRALKESLRFKSDDFEFKSPFWYERSHPDQPLCPKCFANQKIGQMSASYNWSGNSRRQCLVCDNGFDMDLMMVSSVEPVRLVPIAGCDNSLHRCRHIRVVRPPRVAHTSLPNVCGPQWGRSR